jgi:hypothetical protein
MHNGSGKQLRSTRLNKIKKGALSLYPKCSLRVQQLIILPSHIQERMHHIQELNQELLEDMTFIDCETFEVSLENMKRAAE